MAQNVAWWWPDRLKNWQYFGQGLIIFVVLAPLFIGENDQIWDS